MKTNLNIPERVLLNYIEIKVFVRKLILQGIISDEELLRAVDSVYNPKTLQEMALYSEAILVTKYSLLN